jgi:hypothetical protein
MYLINAVRKPCTVQAQSIKELSASADRLWAFTKVSPEMSAINRVVLMKIRFSSA